MEYTRAHSHRENKLRLARAPSLPWWASGAFIRHIAHPPVKRTPIREAHNLLVKESVRGDTLDGIIRTRLPGVALARVADNVRPVERRSGEVEQPRRRVGEQACALAGCGAEPVGRIEKVLHSRAHHDPWPL